VEFLAIRLLDKKKKGKLNGTVNTEKSYYIKGINELLN
jgi:hypothetical protein